MTDQVMIIDFHYFHESSQFCRITMFCFNPLGVHRQRKHQLTKISLPNNKSVTKVFGIFIVEDYK